MKRLVQGMFRSSSSARGQWQQPWLPATRPPSSQRRGAWSRLGVMVTSSFITKAARHCAVLLVSGSWADLFPSRVTSTARTKQLWCCLWPCCHGFAPPVCAASSGAQVRQVPKPQGLPAENMSQVTGALQLPRLVYLGDGDPALSGFCWLLAFDVANSGSCCVLPQGLKLFS